MRSVATLGVIVMCLVFVGSGCVSGTTGNQQLTHDNVSKIEKGKTTRDEVIAILGEPIATQLLADGHRTMLYEGSQVKSEYGQNIFQAAVPIIGPLVPSTNTQSTRSERLQIILDANDVVQDYEFSDNTSEVKTTTSMFGGHVDETTTSNIPQK